MSWRADFLVGSEWLGSVKHGYDWSGPILGAQTEAEYRLAVADRLSRPDASSAAAGDERPWMPEDRMNDLTYQWDGNHVVLINHSETTYPCEGTLSTTAPTSRLLEAFLAQAGAGMNRAQRRAANDFISTLERRGKADQAATLREAMS